DRLDHDETVYLTYDPANQRPSEQLRVPALDLRPELDDPATLCVADQIAARGYAVARHRVLKQALSCSRVIAWNSVCCKNDSGVRLKDVPKQQGPEKDLSPVRASSPPPSPPTSIRTPLPVDSFKRVQIINIWRSLVGPVTNAPLAMLDFRSMDPVAKDLSRHASIFGIGMDLHHSPAHRWGYIRHQMPDEIIFLKCYDSFQGADGSALYSGHVAADVGDDDRVGVPVDLIRARESVEVRLVAVWE
ncbi:hypothetical protein HK405_015647, partial [Cladochytrium tenue]